MAAFCTCFLSLYELQAGTVRTVYSDNITILPVFLRMGQSTVLRFIEKPKKVVLGNSNYYSVEFIDNDIAIQPLGAVTTNLFVYGMKNVYGFILKTNLSDSYDDLVQVDLKENKLNSETIIPLMMSPFKEVLKQKIIFQVGGDLRVTLSRMQRFDGKDFYLIDFQFENISKTEINLSKIEIFLSRKKIKISPQEFFLRETKLKPGEFTKARVFVSVNKRSDVSLEIYYKGLSIKQNITGRFL